MRSKPARTGRGAEVMTLVVYDVQQDRVRNKCYEACKDFGLRPVQFSTFCGLLPGQKRKELFLRLKDLLKRQEGIVLVLPVCAKDWKQLLTSGEPLGISHVKPATIT